MRSVGHWLFFVLPLTGAVVAAGCGGGSIQPLPSPSGSFSVTQSVAVTSVATPLPLPHYGSFGGSVTLAAATVPGGETLQETITNIPPSAAPVLQSRLRAAALRSTQSVVPGSQVLYVLLSSNDTFALSAPPTFTLTIPASDLGSDPYYLALYDPTQPQLGWQQGYAGPATVSGTTLTFTPSASAPFALAAGVQYAFGVYQNTGAAPSPSAASPSPSPTPTVAPVAVSAATTQTYVGTPQTFTASEAGYAGAFTASTTCTNGANSTGSVGTVSPSAATPTTSGGSVTFTFTPQNAGACTVSITGAATATLQFNVSASSVGVN